MNKLEDINIRNYPMTILYTMAGGEYALQDLAAELRRGQMPFNPGLII